MELSAVLAVSWTGTGVENDDYDAMAGGWWLPGEVTGTPAGRLVAESLAPLFLSFPAPPADPVAMTAWWLERLADVESAWAAVSLVVGDVERGIAAGTVGDAVEMFQDRVDLEVVAWSSYAWSWVMGRAGVDVVRGDCVAAGVYVIALAAPDPLVAGFVAASGCLRSRWWAVVAADRRVGAVLDGFAEVTCVGDVPADEAFWVVDPALRVLDRLGDGVAVGDVWAEAVVAERTCPARRFRDGRGGL